MIWIYLCFRALRKCIEKKVEKFSKRVLTNIIYCDNIKMSARQGQLKKLTTL